MTDTIKVKGLRAIDALVAEKVMGWVPFRPVDRDQPNEWVTPDDKTKAMTGQVVALIDDWSPTTDANAMLAVVERLRELGWRWFPGNADAPKWDVSVSGWRTILVEANSLHLATCLAAVEAVTGKLVELEEECRPFG